MSVRWVGEEEPVPFVPTACRDSPRTETPISADPEPKFPIRGRSSLGVDSSPVCSGYAFLADTM